MKSARLESASQDHFVASLTHKLKNIHQVEEAVQPVCYSMVKNQQQKTESDSTQKKENLSLSYLINTLWLFTESDFATFAIPVTFFGVFGAMAGPLLTSNEAPDLLVILAARAPCVFLYNWTNLLIFDVANQRSPESVEEDTWNKPWRPLPSGRITIPQTRRLLLVALPVVLAINWIMGVWQETALLYGMNWMYNDLKGADEDFVVRNLIIGVAFGLYNEGGLKIACGIDQSITASGYWWTVLISCVIFTTMHVQDLKDQAGDKATGRRSAPLVLGDTVVRWTIAVPIGLWSVICPLFLKVGSLGYLITCVLGFLIVMRIFNWRSIDADRKTWKFWAAWTAVLYMLPVIKNPIAFSRFIDTWVK